LSGMAIRNSRGRGARSAPYESARDDDDGLVVYVGNLPFDVDWKQLKDFCGQGGAVAHADVKSGEDGRSRGFGIVKFQSTDDAANAIETLNGCDLGGREVIVRLDNGGKRGDGGGGRGGGKGKGKGSRDGGKGKGGSKGGKGKGKGKGGGNSTSASDLDNDLDSYWTGKNAPEATKVKKMAADKGSLDDDLDSYFAAKVGKAEAAADE